MIKKTTCVMSELKKETFLSSQIELINGGNKLCASNKETMSRDDIVHYLYHSVAVVVYPGGVSLTTPSSRWSVPAGRSHAASPRRARM